MILVSMTICYGKLNKVICSGIYLYCVVKVNLNSDLFDNRMFQKRNYLFEPTHKQTYEGIWNQYIKCRIISQRNLHNE